MKSSILSQRRNIGTVSRGAGLAVFMLAMLLPLPEEAAGYQKSSSKVCEGKPLSFEVRRPLASTYDGQLTYKIRVKGGSAEAGQDYEQPPEKMTFNAYANRASFSFLTLSDEIDEGDESVELELHEPKAPQFRGWVSVDGSQVRIETLVLQTITLSGTILDDSGQAASCADQR